MTKKPDPLDLAALFQRAAAQGAVTNAVATTLSGDLGSLVIAGAAGLAAEDIQASDVTLVTLLVDASSSIGDRGLEAAVRDGQRTLLDAFAGSSDDGVLVAQWVFASDVRVLHGYVPVKDAARLDAQNYQVGGTTHLHDATYDAMAANLAYAQTLRDAGTPVLSIVVVVTDGEDVGSKRSARTCAKLAKDLVASEQFLLAFVGVGSDVDFKKTAAAIGFPDGSVLVAKDATPHALRQAFRMVSRSALQASRGRVAPGPQQAFFSHP
jgi:hypothetical protein